MGKELGSSRSSREPRRRNNNCGRVYLTHFLNSECFQHGFQDLSRAAIASRSETAEWPSSKAEDKGRADFGRFWTSKNSGLPKPWRLQFPEPFDYHFMKLPNVGGYLREGSLARPKRVIVGLTGATGSILGIRLLEALRTAGVETHAIVSKWGISTMEYETQYSIGDVRRLASHFYHIKDMSAAISSGSFEVDSMVIAPCSMKTLAACRAGFGDDLIARAADVVMKERRKLVLVVRETPLSSIHLENMLFLSQNGAVIFPPVPAFYTMPKSLDDLVNQSVGRILDQIGVDTGEFKRWQGGLKKH